MGPGRPQGSNGRPVPKFAFFLLFMMVAGIVALFAIAQLNMNAGYRHPLERRAKESRANVTPLPTIITSVPGLADQKILVAPGAYDPGKPDKVWYEPQEVEVEAGAVVIWKNADGVVHTVTADDGAFDSGLMQAGQTFKFTFTKPGTYAYRCIPHPWMKGKVTVK